MAVTTSKNTQCQVEIRAGQRRLPGILNVPADATGVVAFAHGSGSGRLSCRNQYVAHVLQQAGFATLLLDLLEDQEAGNRGKIFDIELLADRLLRAGHWLRQEPDTAALPLGYFGASTGAGAAIVAAAREPSILSAMVSRGGRPDLAEEYLSDVEAPTLLIVGGNDEAVMSLNEEALQKLRCPKELVIIRGATHLFPEPGALEEVACAAKEWFLRYLVPHRDTPRS